MNKKAQWNALLLTALGFFVLAIWPLAQLKSWMAPSEFAREFKYYSAAYTLAWLVPIVFVPAFVAYWRASPVQCDSRSYGGAWVDRNWLGSSAGLGADEVAMLLAATQVGAWAWVWCSPLSPALFAQPPSALNKS